VLLFAGVVTRSELVAARNRALVRAGE